MSVPKKDVILFVLEDPTPLLLHQHCVPELCVTLSNGDICLTRPFKDYLQTQARAEKYFSKAYPNLKGNDWSFLKRENVTEVLIRERIVQFFSSSKGYRLRFKKHREEGKQYLNDLLKAIMPKGYLLRNIWGEPFIETRLQNRLDVLFVKAEQSSVSSIYRVYDLANKTQNRSLELPYIIPLLFALGHAQQASSQSVSQLVARYEFFFEFSRQKLIHYEKESDSVETARRKHQEFILSPEALKEAIELWTEYQAAYAKYLGNASTFASCAMNDQKFLQELKAVFAKPPRTKEEKFQKFPLNFRGEVEAIYHAFKHQKTTRSYHSIASPRSADWSMLQYLKIIRTVILNGTLSESNPPCPTQFDNGRLYTFQLRSADLDIRAFVQNNAGSLAFTLSCYNGS
jgi:hypothetical protein